MISSNSKYSKAIYLRKNGFSYYEISQIQQIAKSTAYQWTKHINLNKSAKNRLKNRIIQGRKKAHLTIKNRNEKQQQENNKWAKSLLNKTSIDNNLSAIICSILYWAEGGKYTKNRIEFTNSDPEMIKTFLVLLRRSFSIDEGHLRLNMHLHKYHNEKTMKKFWSILTKIPYSRINKTYVKPHTRKIIRKGYKGCVRICYYSKEISQKIEALYRNFPTRIE